MCRLTMPVSAAQMETDVRTINMDEFLFRMFVHHSFGTPSKGWIRNHVSSPIHRILTYWSDTMWRRTEKALQGTRGAKSTSFTQGTLGRKRNTLRQTCAPVSLPPLSHMHTEC